jgi:hypothetical protein
MNNYNSAQEFLGGFHTSFIVSARSGDITDITAGSHLMWFLEKHRPDLIQVIKDSGVDPTRNEDLFTDAVGCIVKNW